MNAEQLHDAISLLPADLITEADRKRSARRSPVRWQRYAAMAACLALMVCGSLWCFSLMSMGGAKEASAEAPAAMMQAVPEIMGSAEEAPREEALDTASDVCSGSGENSNTACTAAIPSVTLQIEGHDYPLTGEDKASLALLLAQLDFRAEDVCECIAEITVIVAHTPEYHINLEEGFVRCSRGQALLTQEQTGLIQTIVNTLVS